MAAETTATAGTTAADGRAALELDGGRTIARLARLVELALQPVELTLAQYRVLCALERGAEASRSLAEKLAVKAPTVTTVVDGLVARCLVDRRQDAGGDRRRVSLSLTPEGLALAGTARVAVAARLSEVVGLLGDAAEADLVFRGLELWRQALDADRDRA